MPSLDISGELEKYYNVVSKIRTLTYRILAILPIKLGKVCQGFKLDLLKFKLWFFAFSFRVMPNLDFAEGF